MNKCFVIGFCYCAYQLLVIQICHALTYTDQWAAHISGGEEVAKRIADKHGFTYLGEIMPDYYHFHHHRVSKRSIYPSSHIHDPLSEDPEVHWAEQQVAKKRVKRDVQFNDPKWPRMWYLNRGRMLDMNVMSAWEKGITGSGVRVTILDDGIERDHPDLKKNYDPEASYDVNGHDRDPTPRYDYTNENRHGTRCAGEVAAEANNGVCSVGVAYNAGIGGVRMLDGDVTDAVEARSLSHNPQHIDIYSASWGPDDDGQTVDGPAPLAKKAFEDGIGRGRNGKGSIFVWASGNGGRDGDSCNCDGYTNSIYTLSISSATENGNIPWYSEACSSTLTTTYSSGSGGERQIVTTDLRKDCTEYHTGTSASAPLAAGICALVLQANPALTWRDLQHIVVETARPANLIANDWVTNGVGRKVSHHFGFGLMDASAMVDRALNWTTVPDQHQCQIKAVMPSKKIGVNSAIEVTLESNGCHGSSHEVLYLEHVQAILTLGASRRGQVQIFLTSPSGTKSTLLAKRTRDSSAEGFSNWAFMTTHNWGEISMGRWTLRIENAGATSVLRNWSLVLHGTATHPHAGNNAQSQPQKPNQETKKRHKRRKQKKKSRRESKRRPKAASIEILGPDYVEKRAPIQLVCNATGRSRPPDDVRWYKDGTRFHSDPEEGRILLTKVDGKSLLSMVSIRRSRIRDAGEYTCMAHKRKFDRFFVNVIKSGRKSRKKKKHSSRPVSRHEDIIHGNPLSRRPSYFRSSQRYVRWQ